MKTILALATAVVIFATPALSLAQTPPPAASPMPSAPGAAMPASGKSRGENFPQRKAEIVQHINAHIAELQQRSTCVQAAADANALKACMPPKRDRYAQ